MAPHRLAPSRLQLRRVCQPSPAQDRPQTGSHPCAGIWKEHWQLCTSGHAGLGWQATGDTWAEHLVYSQGDQRPGSRLQALPQERQHPSLATHTGPWTLHPACIPLAWSAFLFFLQLTGIPIFLPICQHVYEHHKPLNLSWSIFSSWLDKNPYSLFCLRSNFPKT